MTTRYRKTNTFLPTDQYQRVNTPHRRIGHRHNTTITDVIDRHNRRWVAKKFDELKGTEERPIVKQKFEPSTGFTWVSLTLLYRLMIGEHVPEACVILNKQDEPIAYLSRQVENPVDCVAEESRKFRKLKNEVSFSDEMTLLKNVFQHTHPAYQFAPCIASWIVWDEHDCKADNLILGDSFSPDQKNSDHSSRQEEKDASPPSKMLYKIDHDFSLRPYSIKYLSYKYGYLDEDLPMNHKALRGFITGDTTDRAVAVYRRDFEKLYYSHKLEHPITKQSNQQKLNQTRDLFNKIIEDPIFQTNFCFYTLKAALITEQMLKRVAERSFPDTHEEDRKLLIKHAKKRLGKLQQSLIAIPKFRQYIANPTFYFENGQRLSGSQAFEHLITQMTTIEATTLEETDLKYSPLVSRAEIEQSYLSLWQQSLKIQLKASPERRTRMYASSTLGSALGSLTGLLIGTLVLSLTMPWILTAVGVGIISGALLLGVMQYFKEEAYIQGRLNEIVHPYVYQCPDWLSETSTTQPLISSEDKTHLTIHSLFSNSEHCGNIDSESSEKRDDTTFTSSISSAIKPNMATN